MDIINNAHPELGNLPLAKNAGLAGLGGAKIEVVFADNQGNPATGQNQALRLITEDKVAAVFGAYQSGITLTSSAIAEKYGIPFLNSRVGRRQSHRARLQMVLPHHADRHRLRQGLCRLPRRHEGRRRQDRCDRAGPRQHRIRHLGRQHDQRRLQGEGAGHRARHRLSRQRDRRAGPGAPAQGQEARRHHHDQLHVGCDPVRQDHAVARLQAGRCCSPTMPAIPIRPSSRRSARSRKASSTARPGRWARPARRPPSSPTCTRRRAARRWTTPSARQMQGFFVLADAIDRAGSTDPAKIQAALKATDLKPEQLMMGYKGVKFDDKGQNVLASGLSSSSRTARTTRRCGRRPVPRRRRCCPTRAGEIFEGGAARPAIPMMI